MNTRSYLKVEALAIMCFCLHLSACRQRPPAQDTEGEAVIIAVVRSIHVSVYAEGVRIRDIVLQLTAEPAFRFIPRSLPFTLHPEAELDRPVKGSFVLSGTHQPAVLVEIEQLNWEGADLAAVKGSVLFSGKNGARYSWRLRKTGAKWEVLQSNELGQY